MQAETQRAHRGERHYHMAGTRRIIYNSCMALLRTVDACSCSRGRVFMRGFRSERMHHVHHACMIDRSHILSYRWMSRLSDRNGGWTVDCMDACARGRLHAARASSASTVLHLHACMAEHVRWTATQTAVQHPPSIPDPAPPRVATPRMRVPRRCAHASAASLHAATHACFRRSHQIEHEMHAVVVAATVSALKY